MSNATTGILIAAGVAGGAIFYAKRRRRQQKSILARARHKAAMVADRASRLSDSVAEFLDKGRAEVENRKKGVTEALEAGRAAYQRVAR